MDTERGGDHVTHRDQLMVDPETRGTLRLTRGGDEPYTLRSDDVHDPPSVREREKHTDTLD